MHLNVHEVLQTELVSIEEMERMTHAHVWRWELFSHKEGLFCSETPAIRISDVQ